MSPVSLGLCVFYYYYFFFFFCDETSPVSTCDTVLCVGVVHTLSRVVTEGRVMSPKMNAPLRQSQANYGLANAREDFRLRG